MQNEKNKTGEGFNEFVQKHRKPIYVIMGLIIIVLLGCIGYFSLMDVLRGRAISIVEEFNSRYESIRSSIIEIENEDANDAISEDEDASEGEGEGDNEDSVSVASEVDGERALLLAELEPFARKNSGYAGARAWSIIARIYSDQNEWEQSETAWVSAAGKSAKNYLEPLAWFNAAIAAEEQGKIPQAIDYYTNSVTAAIGFPSAPRAQFSIGRLYETLDDSDAAIAAYRAVIAGWPHDQVWGNLANSRIITLEMNE